MFKLPKLEYGLKDLAPFLGEEQMQYHYEKHHNTYIENMNKTLATDSAKAEMPLERLIQESTGPLFNNAAQTYNHCFFWFGLTPKSKTGQASPELTQAIQKDFGSWTELHKQFVDAGLKTFGSGWVWLCATPENQLKIVSTSNAEVPFKAQNLRPLLTADVWEHAYYVDYRNKRQAFLETMNDYINWNFVNENFANKEVRSLHKAMQA